MVRQSFALLLLVGCATSHLAAQDSRADQIQALRLTPGQALHLDGVIEEAFWQRAAVIRDFRQQEPDEGAPATEATEVRIAIDDRNIYVAVMAFDREPDRVVSRILARDQIMEARHDFQFAGDDAVAILFDTFHDSRNAFVFATNPNGAEFEALITDEGAEINVDWRAVWQAAAVRHAQGWSAEFAIPFRTLRYPEDGQGEPWGFNVYRTIRRKSEMVLWQSWSRDNEGFERVSRAGHLIGMENLPRYGINVELKPFALAGTRQELDADGQTPVERQTDIGLDLKSELLPGLVLDLTLNTDFAQVEVDDEQVNLTRFSLFYPEKRDFFLENAGVFDVGFRGGFGPPPYQLFFSRRIGIGWEGEIPILGGARLTGRVGGQTVGLMSVLTAESGDVPITGHSVARIKRDIGENNFLGLMVTDRRNGDGSNTVAAVDGSFWPHPTLNVKGFYNRSFTSGAGGNDHTYSVTADYSTDLVGALLQHLTVGSQARADLGFITRSDIRQTRAEFRLSPRPGRWGIRVIETSVEGEYISTTDGRMQDWGVSFAVDPEFESGDSFRAMFDVGETQLDEGFMLADSIPIPSGRYDTRALRLFLHSGRQRAVVGRVRGGLEQFFGGTLWSVEPSVGLSPSPQVSMELSHEWNRVDVPGGKLTSHITSLRLGYAFSTKFTTNALLQYNSLDKDFSVNLRLNFIHRPGSDLFIVLTEQRGVGNELWQLSNRGLVAKLTYLTRL
ncbi:MAG: hypothetical protein GTN62_06990 [Gemmatimonadales bacterium]|nr:hypothetical protein [Gemmatimonadales bacterium]NIN11245.1 hypothetical protein [Gemmatimonadales bacterium]NIN49844.1 hypothetical protein [Gemmatimonadales bacterium]NIP07308.1 hypothetical protein [Gemmatimonadales bacterium]NIR03003.1 hypothetical protein [Gemmatimonadales bacterium]